MSGVADSALALRLEAKQGIRGYRVEDGGPWYPAVGSVLDTLFGPIAEYRDEAAMHEGSYCHELVRLALTGGLPPDEWDERVGRVLRWLHESKLRVVAVEQPMVALAYGYAGCPDVIAEQPDGRLVILDWKFATSLDRPRYDLQLLAYQRFVKWRGTQAPRLFLVQVPKSGGVRPVPVKPNPAHWAGFLSAVGVLRWRMQQGG